MPQVLAYDNCSITHCSITLHEFQWHRAETRGESVLPARRWNLQSRSAVTICDIHGLPKLALGFCLDI